MIGRIKKDGLQQVAFTCDNKKDVAKIFFLSSKKIENIYGKKCTCTSIFYFSQNYLILRLMSASQRPFVVV